MIKDIEIKTFPQKGKQHVLEKKHSIRRENSPAMAAWCCIIAFCCSICICCDDMPASWVGKDTLELFPLAGGEEAPAAFGLD